MKLFLVLLCAVTYHYCHGYPVIDGEIQEADQIENETSVEYYFDTTNDTSSNDSLIQHGFFKKVGGGIKGGIKSIKSKIGNIKGKIGGGFKDKTGSGNGGGGRYIGGGYRPPRTHSGSGATNPEAVKWVLIGTGVALLVTLGGLSLYYYQTRKRKRVLRPVPANRPVKLL